MLKYWLVLLIAITLIICGFFKPSSLEGLGGSSGAYQTNHYTLSYQELPWCKDLLSASYGLVQAQVPLRHIDEYQKSLEIDKMAKEIKAYWEFYYALKTKWKEPWPITAKTGQNFAQYSQDLAEVIYYFQHEDEELGMRLPIHENTPIYFAMMVAKETSVRANVRGKLGEVGLIQIHRKALNGYSKKEILENPKLGLHLGVRWMTMKLQVCHRDLDIDNWQDKYWLGPLSIYAAGEGEGRARHGRCRILNSMRGRLNLMSRFRREG